MAGLILIALFAVVLVGSLLTAAECLKRSRERREQLADDRLRAIAKGLGRK
jgi:hypothetical protein